MFDPILSQNCIWSTQHFFPILLKSHNLLCRYLEWSKYCKRNKNYNCSSLFFKKGIDENKLIENEIALQFLLGSLAEPLLLLQEFELQLRIVQPLQTLLFLPPESLQLSHFLEPEQVAQQASCRERSVLRLSWRRQYPSRLSSFRRCPSCW